MTAACEFLRFGASRGWVARALIDRLSRPKYLQNRVRGTTGVRMSRSGRSLFPC